MSVTNATAPSAISAGMPILVVDNVIGPELAAGLVDHANGRGWFESPMVRADVDGAPTLRVDRNAKARLDHRLDTDHTLTRLVQGAMVERLLPTVAAAFRHSPQSHEAFKLVRYDAGNGWFRPHRDNVTPDAAHRRVAVTLNLDEGYDGGFLRFPEIGPELFRPAPGSAIVFPCDVLHEVTPVVAGRRHALVTFLW